MTDKLTDAERAQNLERIRLGGLIKTLTPHLDKLAQAAAADDWTGADMALVDAETAFDEWATAERKELDAMYHARKADDYDAESANEYRLETSGRL